MEKPLASCVCVTYDRPHLINELLYCFLAQDYENKELIILNDQYNIKYRYDDKRVRIYNLPIRFPSLGAKRNYTKKLIRGDYIFIMDDDDIYYSNHVSDLVKLHLEHPEYDIVGKSVVNFSQDNKDIVTIPQGNEWGCNGACISKEYYLTQDFPNHKSFHEDYDFVIDGKAKVYKEESDDISWHYRWGLGIWHISGLEGDGIESYRNITERTETYVNITKMEHDDKIKFITLKPQISEEVKKFYK